MTARNVSETMRPISFEQRYNSAPLFSVGPEIPSSVVNHTRRTLCRFVLGCRERLSTSLGIALPWILSADPLASRFAVTARRPHLSAFSRSRRFKTLAAFALSALVSRSHHARGIPLIAHVLGVLASLVGDCGICPLASSRV